MAGDGVCSQSSFPSALGLVPWLVSFIFLKEKADLFVFLLQQQEISKGTVTFSQSLSFLNGLVRSGDVFLLNFCGMRLRQGGNGMWGHHPQLCAGTDVRDKLLCDHCLAARLLLGDRPGEGLGLFLPPLQSGALTDFITPNRAERLFLFSAEPQSWALMGTQGGQVGISLFSQVTRGNGLKLLRGRIRLHMRENILIKGLSSSGTTAQSSGEVTIPAGISKQPGCGTWGHDRGGLGSANIELNDLGGLFQPK